MKRRISPGCRELVRSYNTNQLQTENYNEKTLVRLNSTCHRSIQIIKLDKIGLVIRHCRPFKELMSPKNSTVQL